MKLELKVNFISIGSQFYSALVSISATANKSNSLKQKQISSCWPLKQHLYIQPDISSLSTSSTTLFTSRFLIEDRENTSRWRVLIKNKISKCINYRHSFFLIVIVFLICINSVQHPPLRQIQSHLFPIWDQSLVRYLVVAFWVVGFLQCNLREAARII